MHQQPTLLGTATQAPELLECTPFTEKVDQVAVCVCARVCTCVRGVCV